MSYIHAARRLGQGFKAHTLVYEGCTTTFLPTTCSTTCSTTLAKALLTLFLDCSLRLRKARLNQRFTSSHYGQTEPGGWGDHGLGHFMGNFFATCTTFSVSYPALRSRRRILVRKVPDPLPFTSFDWCILRLGFINCLSLPCVQWSKHGDGLAVIEGCTIRIKRHY